MKKILMVITTLFLVTVSCTENFEEINTNRNAVTAPQPGQLFNRIVTTPVFDYQRNVNLYADFYAQYWANTVDGFESGRYEYVDGWAFTGWNAFFVDGLANIKSLQSIYGDDPFYNNLMQVLEIWEVSEWARMLAYYGDLPYFEIDFASKVPYDSERDIYYDLFERLDKAVNAIDVSSTNQYVMPSAEDLIYGWDLDKWKRFGNSMRLRLAMRISNVDPGKAQTEAVAAINGGVMQSNDDVAHIPAWVNGFYDYLRNMAILWDNIRCSKTFIDLMYSQTSMEDPRARIWFDYKESSPMFGSERLEGVENGYNILPADANDFATMNENTTYIGFTGNDAEIDHYQPVMLYAEVVFLKAEAALRGWTGGDPTTLMQEGVRASMEFVGVDSAAATAYINEVPVLSGSNEEQLKQLITQKYIANFPNGREAWVDFRRTDYPDLTLPIDGVSSAASVAQGTYVKRIRYPDNAFNTESEMLPTDQNTINTNRMDNKLWWDVADTKTKSNGLMNSNF